MAVGPKKVVNVVVGDKVFTLRLVKKVVVEATQITLVYDDGSEDVHQPTDTIPVGDPTAP